VTAAGGASVVVLQDAEAVSLAAAEDIAATLGTAVAERGRAHLGATGGSTPAGFYRLLASSPLRERVPWDAVDIWFGDDRFVPRDHPLSNVLIVDQVLVRAAAYSGQSGGGDSGLDIERGADPGVVIPAAAIHPFPCGIAIGEGRGAAWCAERYAEEIRAAMPLDSSGWPVFDHLFLGIGPDGHLLSVFPGSSAIGSSDLALAIPAPTHVEPHVERVTLNPAVIGAARRVLVVIHGASKAAVLADIFGSVNDAARWPAQLARRAGVTWLLDREAAAQLPADAVQA
jgi:6-phosphogluconolactonase